MGWDLLPDGELLTTAEANGYELFITSDQKIRYQQNLAGRRLAILVLMLNNWSAIRWRVDDIVAAVNQMQPGDYLEMEIPYPPAV